MNYDKLYKKITKIKNKSIFKKELILKFFKNSEFFNLKNDDIIFYISHFYKIPKKELDIFFKKIDNISEILIFYLTDNLKYNKKFIIPQKVIRETFITSLSLEFMHFCYNINNKNNVVEILLINYIDYLFDEIKINDKIKKYIHFILYKKHKNFENNISMNDLSNFNIGDNEDILKNIIYFINKIENQEIITLLFQSNYNSNFDNINKKYLFIVNYLNTFYSVMFNKNIIQTYSLLITVLDDLIDLKEDIIIQSDNIFLGDNFNIYKIISSILDVYYGCVKVGEPNYKIKFFNDMILNIMSLGVIKNRKIIEKGGDYNKVINLLNTKVFLPLDYVDELCNNDINKKILSLQFSKYNFMLSYYLFNVETRLLKYQIPREDCYNISFLSKYNINKVDFNKQNEIVKVILKEVINTIQKELNIVDLLDEHISNKNIMEIIDFILSNQGKNIRSIFNILLYLTLNYDKYKDLKNKNKNINFLLKNDENLLKLIQYCASLEIIHLASLIHDDVIDESTIRRKNPSLNVKYSNKIAILFGDYLITKVYQLLNKIDGFDQLNNKNIITLIQTLINGEINELNSNYKPTTFSKYTERIYQKTGIFLQINAEIISKIIYPDGDNKKNEFVKQLGSNLGIAFQIKDDLLDYQSDLKTLGKPVYEDLIKGIITAPYLFAVEEYKDLSTLLTLLELEKIKKEKVQEIFNNIIKNEKEMNKHSFLDKTQELINHYLELTLYNLNEIINIENNYSNNEFLRDFIKLIIFIGTRDR